MVISNSFQAYLETIHRAYASLDDGAVADYIPELTKADPDWFGIAIVTVDGFVYQVGDSRQPFTIQSISKAITYGLALEDRGIDAVLTRVDVEPSGEAFNSISLEPGTGRPRNPMINAGAIATVGLVAGDSPTARFKHIVECYSRYLGYTPSVDEEVYRSEKVTGNRNRAIAYLMQCSNILDADTESVLDVYFRQCSILVTCRDLALIGATLANNGVNPITGVRALKSQFVSRTLSVMSSCGMYDYSGAWIYEVGMPAKSGVGGGIMAVLPGQFGLAVFSPRLDDRGNSARGIAVCKRISADFSLHMLQSGASSVTSVVHSSYDIAQVPSKQARNETQRSLLADIGGRACVFELQGELVFAAAEIVVRECMRIADTAEVLIMDFTRVGAVADGALRLLTDLVRTLHERGKVLLIAGLNAKYPVVRALRRHVPEAQTGPLLACSELDAAKAWAEEHLLAGRGAFSGDSVPLAAQALCATLTAVELDLLARLVDCQDYAPGASICTIGDTADHLYFIASGHVTVSVPLGNDRMARISTISAGAAFGEMALVDRGKRSANVTADTAVEAFVLDYARLTEEGDPALVSLQLKLTTNIARELVRKLRQATFEIQLLRS